MKLMICFIPSLCLALASPTLELGAIRTRLDQYPVLTTNYYQFNGTVLGESDDNKFLKERDLVPLPAANFSAIVPDKRDTIPGKTDFPKLADSILKKYTGTYSLSIAPKRTMVVELNDGHLQARVSETILQLDFETVTKFRFKDVVDASGEFILVNGMVTKIAVEQGGHFEWIRTP